MEWPNFDLTFCSLYMFWVALKGGFWLFKCWFLFNWMFRHVGRLALCLRGACCCGCCCSSPFHHRNLCEQRIDGPNHCGNKQPATWSTTSVWTVGACHRNHLLHTFYIIFPIILSSEEHRNTGGMWKTMKTLPPPAGFSWVNSLGRIFSR